MMRKFLATFFTLALLISCTETETLNVSPNGGGSSSSDSSSNVELEIIDFGNISISADQIDAGEVHFTSDNSWMIEMVDITGGGIEWVTFDYTQGSAGEHQISITVTANSSSESRSVEAILFVDGIAEASSVITQAGVDASAIVPFSLKETTLYHTSYLGGEIEIVATQGQIVACDVDDIWWITILEMDESRILLELYDNIVSSYRTQKIYVEGNDDQIIEVTIEQSGIIYGMPYIEFTDENFKTKMLTYYDKDNDGEITESEAELELSDYVTVNVSDSNIYSLDGIEYFVNLKRFNCSGNYITSFNASLFPLLSVLWCENNDIKSLDFSACPNIMGVYANGNSNLSSIAGLSQKQSLYSLYLYDTALESIDISGCPSIDYTYFRYGGITTLKSLNASGSGLRYISPMANAGTVETPYIESIDVSGCESLETITLDNASSLSSLNVDDCPLLYQILILNGNNFSELKIDNADALRTIFVTGGNMRTLTINNCDELTSVTANYNGLTKLNLSGCSKLEGVSCDNNPLESFDDITISSTAMTLLDISNTYIYGEIPSFYEKCSEISIVGPYKYEYIYYTCTQSSTGKYWVQYVEIADNAPGIYWSTEPDSGINSLSNPNAGFIYKVSASAPTSLDYY